MSRSYRHIKEHKLELNELKKEGFTENQIGEKLGFGFKQVHNFLYRQMVNQRIIAAEIALKRKGRPPRDYVVSEQDRVAELKYILARKDAKIKLLEMENELMRDLLSYTEWK